MKLLLLNIIDKILSRPFRIKLKKILTIKTEIVNQINKSTEVYKMFVLSTVEAFMEVIRNLLAKNDNMYLRDFGSLIVRKRTEQTTLNISKNTTVIIPICCV